MADLQRRLEHIRRRGNIPRMFRDRTNPLEFLSATEVYMRYRFGPDSIITLVGILFRSLERSTLRSLPLPPMLSVLVTLQFLASGAHYILIGDLHGVSTSSICRAVHQTTTHIAALLHRFVRFPHGRALTETQREFYNVAGFPKVVGVIDCTHIPIKAPSDNEPDYVNRKGVHSINVQMVCNARFGITNVCAKWPGSVHDSRIFRESTLRRSFEEGQIDGYLLGDSGYACKPYLMTPYLNPTTPAQERFNRALVKTRVLVEQTFGMIKRRFPCLAYGLRIKKPSRCCKTIIACVVLHQFGIMRGDTFGRTTDITDNPPDEDVQIDAADNGMRHRVRVTATYFT